MSPAPAPTDPRRLTRPQLAAVALGNGFEFYDFTVYALFAAPIGRALFPAASPWTSLLLSVAAFGLGFGARPAGALFFGLYADRRGRKPAMLLTVALMALGTLALAAVPGHAVLGWGSGALAVAARLVQGFALGGEIGPSTAYLLEASRPGGRARAVSWQIALHGAALAGAGLVALGLAAALPPAALDAWGWRVALLLGLGVVPAGLAVRASLPDAPAPPRRPLLRPVLARPGVAAAAVAVIASGSVAFYVATYLTTYAGAALKLPPATAALAAVASGVATLFAAVPAGRLADRHGRRGAFLLSRLGFAALALPAFAWLAADRGAGTLLAVSAGLAALNTLGAPAGLCLILEAMPGRSRATGLALAYALGTGLFGGLTQLAATALIAWTGDPLSPAWLLVAAGLAGAAAVRALPPAAGVDEASPSLTPPAPAPAPRAPERAGTYSPRPRWPNSPVTSSDSHRQRQPAHHQRGQRPARPGRQHEGVAPAQHEVDRVAREGQQERHEHVEQRAAHQP